MTPHKAPNAQAQDKDDMDLPLSQKIAIIMVALGEEASGEVMKHLGERDIEVITQLKRIPVETMDRILEDFEQHLMAGEWISQGGMDFARAALERAVGPRKAQEILERVATQTSSGFYIPKNVAAEQIAPFIVNEHPQAVALILSQLDAAQASGMGCVVGPCLRRRRECLFPLRWTHAAHRRADRPRLHSHLPDRRRSASRPARHRRSTSWTSSAESPPTHPTYTLISLYFDIPGLL